jgi:hypothetical protein
VAKRPDQTRHLLPGNVRPPRLPNGTRVHVKSRHFAEQCDGVVTAGHWDGRWVYRITVTGGTAPKAGRNEKGELWVWDAEVTPLP